MPDEEFRKMVERAKEICVRCADLLDIAYKNHVETVLARDGISNNKPE